jgi:ABC-type phosphate transport system auxiliary subunit
MGHRLHVLNGVQEKLADLVEHMPEALDLYDKVTLMQREQIVAINGKFESNRYAGKYRLQELLSQPGVDDIGIRADIEKLLQPNAAVGGAPKKRKTVAAAKRSGKKKTTRATKK